MRFVRATGEGGKPTPTAVGFTRYAKDRLGCETPVGLKERAFWFTRLKNEMEAQGWSFEDLIKTVDYLRAEHIRIKVIDGVFWYVDRAKAEIRIENFADLQVKVARALLVESDPRWVKRLSLAQGKALERVYVEWSRKNEQKDAAGNTDRHRSGHGTGVLPD